MHRGRARQSQTALSSRDHSVDELSKGSEITNLLAKRVMGWDVTPDRFMLGKRQWVPRWRFQPIERIQDAFELLEKAAPQHFEMCRNDTGVFSVRIRIARATGAAQDKHEARAITMALARALGFGPPTIVDTAPSMPTPIRNQGSRSKTDGL